MQGDGSTVAGEKAEILVRVCAALEEDEAGRAKVILGGEYPFVATLKATRKYTERQCLRVFYRDGFLDRYSGTKLVHPGALRTLSKIIPDEFPAHPNWSMSQTHFAYWELFPTIDHVVPVTRGGADEEANWVTTSMLRNSAKAHWTLDELGWPLVTAGSSTAWDGLTGWFVRYTDHHPQLAADPYLGKWLRATKAVQAEGCA
ncbi:HNH endonuclease [Rhodococcus sp. WAY2]|uniref:HNH endonuclease n=1 Tax=Rhodococcus sp. WAY2 TaxID=2663121 RepID=UPI00131FAF9E|nr:HNH endonuclease [Rhodococcus sp. WAY2]QHE73883.1 hypothetical protein GFS60_07554 [Rhodococcus sp. WAY2]